jgi:peptidoglycan-associated lipoprotein
MKMRLWSVACLCAVGCASKQEVAPPPAAAPAPAAPAQAQTTPSAPQNATLAAMTCKIDTQCAGDQICVEFSCTAVAAALDACVGARVQFPFNSADLPEGANQALQRTARCLTASPSITLTIEGNADERGTEEYNLALGEQRAKAVARYLKNLGATEAQLKTISYGKDQPLCTDHDEACWEKNRRAALKVSPLASE